jgi:hypothetical protein
LKAEKKMSNQKGVQLTFLEGARNSQKGENISNYLRWKILSKIQTKNSQKFNEI